MTHYLLSLLLCPVIYSADPPQEPSYLRPGSPESGGIRHLCLIYHGQKRRVAWTMEAILPYVAYIDEKRRPVDGLFDSFLFMEFATDQGASLCHEGEDKGDARPTAADWKWLAEAWFRPTTGLVGLEKAVTHAGKILGQPDHTANVVISLPIPRSSLKQFGPLPGQQKQLDFSNQADRRQALTWHIEEVLARWKHGDYPHLRLLGFYWTAESTLPEDNDLIRWTSQSLHSRQLKLYWIPYLGAEGFSGWRERGLDAVLLQPGYFFAPSPEPHRLLSAAKQAKRQGWGLEVEVDTRALSSADLRDRFRDYLDAGVEYGWMNDSVVGWYEGGDGIKLFAETPGAGRELYTDVYRFIKKKYTSTGRLKLPKLTLISRDNRDNLALASKGARITGCVRPKDNPALAPEKIIDGQLDFYAGTSEFGYCEIPGSFTIELPEATTLARTQMLLWDLDGRWFQYRIETSPDNQRWELAVDKSKGQWSGWQVDRFAPRTARYIRVTPLHNSVGQMLF